ncbi:MAG: YggT family protein [Chloroflexi bacterium]|nr:YggT family protein [Chloroflexota bacterium]
MLQRKEPRSVERHETTRVDERTAPSGGPITVASRFDQTERTEQAAQSTGGVEQRERVVTDQAGLAHRERTVHDVAAEHRQRLLKVSQVIWLVVGIAEVLIGLRVVLKLIGANPANDFAGFVYNFAGVFLAPFFGLTGSPSSGSMVLEVPSLIAMLVYALLGWVIVSKILPLFDQQTTRSTSTYDRYRG